MTTINIDEARALFSRPTSDKEESENVGDIGIDVESKVKAVKSAVTNIHGEWSDDEKRALALAKKRKARFAVIDTGDDAIILFGKHHGTKVSILSVDPSGRDYLRWMVGQSFDESLLKVVRKWLART
jgi:hypothetical protein